jgi:hypothetical protein
MRRFLLLVLLLAPLAAPAAAPAFTIGISDQKLEMWHDARFARLGIRRVRLLVAYDSVLRGDFSRYDAWMAAAHARGYDVLLTIDRDQDSYTRMPSNRAYRRVVRRLRARYPWVRSMAAWNEANHQKQPTYRKPWRAAQYYNIMRAECPGCRVVAADVLGARNMARWLTRFKRTAVRPRLWGLHSYRDANRPKPLWTTDAAQMLRLVRGKVWFTEAGGIVRFAHRYPGGRKGQARAAAAVRRTFRLASLLPRVQRVYLYHWNADRRFVTWDSGLVGARGRPRPALGVLQAELRRQRRR